MAAEAALNIDFSVHLLYDNKSFRTSFVLIFGRCGGTGRRKGLKIPRWKHRTGSIPVSGTKGTKRQGVASPLGFFFLYRRLAFFLLEGFDL